MSLFPVAVLGFGCWQSKRRVEATKCGEKAACKGRGERVAWKRQSGRHFHAALREFFHTLPSKMDEEEILQLMILHYLRKRRLNRRRYWVHKINQCRSMYGEYHHLFEQVLSDDEKCLSYIRMKSSTFKRLLDKVGPFLQKRTTNFRKPLPPGERLVITLW